MVVLVHRVTLFHHFAGACHAVNVRLLAVGEDNVLLGRRMANEANDPVHVLFFRLLRFCHQLGKGRSFHLPVARGWHVLRVVLRLFVWGSPTTAEEAAVAPAVFLVLQWCWAFKSLVTCNILANSSSAERKFVDCTANCSANCFASSRFSSFVLIEVLAAGAPSAGEEVFLVALATAAKMDSIKLDEAAM